MARVRLRKAFAVLLAASMTISMVTAGVAAVGDEPEIQTSVALSTVALPNNVSVAYGTEVEEVLEQLPATLTGTVAEDPAEVETPVENEDPAETIETETGTETETASDTGTGAESGALTETETLAEPETVEVPVTWSCATEGGYNGWIAGEYTFVAAVGEPYVYSQNISVTVVVEACPEFVAAIGDNQYTSMEEAVNAAVSGDTIVLLSNIFEGKAVGIIANSKNTANTNGVLDLTIDMNGYTICCAAPADTDASPYSIFTAVYDVDYRMGTLTIKNGTFKGAEIPGYRINSAISCTGNLVMENCVVENTTAENYGTVIASNSLYGVNVTVKNCQFINNTTQKAGTVCVEDNIKTVIENTTFTGNYAGWYGGALYITSVTGGEVEIKDSNFTGNSADDLGGAIFIKNVTAEITGNLTDNSTNGSGGAICARNSTVTVTGNLTDNSAEQYGGAIYAEATNITVNGNLTDNSTKRYGGAVYAYNSTLNVTGNLMDNSAEQHGGAIYAQSTYTTVNGNLTGNSAGLDGGAICLYQYQLNVTGDITGNTAGGNGGGIYSTWSTVDVKGAVTGNNASMGGGVYTAANAAGEAFNGKIGLTEAQVYNNSASTAGADIWSGENNQTAIKTVGTDWVLSGCNDAIDGWYDDSEDARWSAHTAPIHVEAYTSFDEDGTAAVDGALALKAAHAEPYVPPTPSYNYYTVTVNYLDKDTGEKVAASYTSPSRIQGSRYDVTEYDAIAIDGYTYDSTSGDALTGTLNSNKVVNVYYVADDTDIPDDDTPTGDVPDLPDDPGETDIPDDDTPTGDLPDQPDQPDESGETDIPDGDVPTGDLPQTGTTSSTAVLRTVSGVFLCLAVVFGGVTVVLFRKEREQG